MKIQKLGKTDRLSMEFPHKFKCENCAKTHTSEFQAAFVRDTVGNWYFDLGKIKGFRSVPDDVHEALEAMFHSRTTPCEGKDCPHCTPAN
jgi:hypothetical protein